MDVVKGLRLLAASLLMFTGIFHLAMAAYAAESVMAPGSALFGVLYVVLGIGLFAGRRLFNYLGVVITFVGLIVGTYAYVAISPEPVIPPLAVIDIIIILCCCYLILHKTSS
jgi:hypothetical protein